MLFICSSYTHHGGFGDTANDKGHMDPEDLLTRNFCCVKCRGRSAVAKTVPLSKSLPHLLSLSADKYILLSCALCGYTEIYNTQAFATSEEEARAAENLPLTNEG